MKFSPCASKCSGEGTYCKGCNRTHDEINETKALVAVIIVHLRKYNYDDPENFLKMLALKSLKRMRSG
ncbi:MAG: DUF1289 domain-containing protein [Psychromonas sp.]|nr:DUF1289 domain-containing protein [Psychromonas sp.]